MKKLTKGNSLSSDQSDNVKLLENSSDNLAYHSFEKHGVLAHLVFPGEAVPHGRGGGEVGQMSSSAVYWVILVDFDEML